MSEAAGLPDRVTRLEHDMAEVRFLATKAEKEASDCTAVLHGHTGVLNAIREDQVEQSKKIAKIDGRLGRVEADVRTGFARVNAEMGEMRGEMREMRGNIATLAQGQEQITELLTRHVGECDSGKEG